MPPYGLNTAKNASRELALRLCALAVSRLSAIASRYARSRAQRVGILDHVGPPAGGGPRREQYKPRRREHPGRKISAHGQIVRDILVGGVAQPRQRHMRGEFAPFRI